MPSKGSAPEKIANYFDCFASPGELALFGNALGVILCLRNINVKRGVRGWTSRARSSLNRGKFKTEQRALKETVNTKWLLTLRSTITRMPLDLHNIGQKFAVAVGKACTILYFESTGNRSVACDLHATALQMAREGNIVNKIEWNEEELNGECKNYWFCPKLLLNYFIKRS